jgi:heptosyltransferase-1
MITAMNAILLVKTSSLGDVVHNLPVASDIRAAFPGAAIDWVVEEGFAAIPRMHPAVRGVLPVAIRRWRASWWRDEVRSEVGRFLEVLREKTYDAVIDTQGLLKSALIARAARGVRYGLDWASSREPLRPFYDRTFSIPRSMHAVERNRVLAARALGYALQPRVDYGIHPEAMEFPWLSRRSYAVLIHVTSAARKLWPEKDWIALGRHLQARDIAAVLPWGTAAERDRSARLAQDIPGAIVPPALRLAEIAGLLAGARLVLGVDTGLTHLAVAVGTPTVGVYGATDPAATGLYGSERAVNAGGRGRMPQAAEIIAAVDRLTS